MFLQAAEDMTLSQMIHENSFNYYESMSALELMDPKMDSGMLVDGKCIPTIATRLEKGIY